VKLKLTNYISGTGKQKRNSSSHPLFFQPKLTINQPNDVYEQEADAVAQQVMRMPVANDSFFQPRSTFIQRKCTACEEEPKVRMKVETTAAGGIIAPSSVSNVINSTGQPLNAETKSFMESSFGYDFGNIQIHNDSLAHQSSADINAMAYTHGNHVAFATGKYQPHTHSGKKLLAHELTHVVQQSGAVNRKPDRGETVQRTPGEEEEVKPKPAPVAPAPVQPAGFSCTPQPVSHADFLKQAKILQFDPAKAFGITVLTGNNIVLPAVQLDSKHHLLPTTTSITVPSFFIKKNELYPDENGKKGAFSGPSTCVDDIIHYLITPGGAVKIEEGENEHCQDFQLAFTLSLLKYANAVNKLAKSKKWFKDLGAANKELKKSKNAGLHPDDWPDHFLCLIDTTRARDKISHKPPLLMYAKPYPTERNCKYPVVRIEAATFPDIGLTPSKNIVKGC